ncbi:hypothetical protein, partial [Mediterraneibacter gnavus]
MEDPRIISALFIFLKMAYYNVLINSGTMPLDTFTYYLLKVGFIPPLRAHLVLYKTVFTVYNIVKNNLRR